MGNSTQESRAVVEAWYTALGAGDMEGVVGAMDENIVVNVVGRTPVSGRYEGREAFVAGAIGRIFAVLDPETVHFGKRWTIFVAEGSRVAALMEGEAATTSGKRYDGTYCHLFTIEDGRIVELYEFLDTVLLQDAIFGNPLSQPESEPAVALSF